MSNFPFQKKPEWAATGKEGEAGGGGGGGGGKKAGGDQPAAADATSASEENQNQANTTANTHDAANAESALEHAQQQESPLAY